MTEISEAGTSFLRDLGEAARSNPVSAALIGMGVFWMFGGVRAAQIAGSAVAAGAEPGRRTWDSMRSSANSAARAIGNTASDSMDSVRSSTRSGASAIGGREGASKTLETVRSSAQSAADSIGSGFNSAADKLQDNAAAAVNNVTELGRRQAGVISEYARSIPTLGVDTFESARSSLAELFRTQPLALGAIGLAVGAGIAAALPASEWESEYLGEASDSLKNKASKLAETASEEARRQGLSVDGARAAASDLSAKLNQVAEAGARGFSPSEQR